MTTPKTQQQQRETADRIAAEHGCEITPTTTGGTALLVSDRHRRGFPLDGRRISDCLAALKRAGVDTTGWLS